MSIILAIIFIILAFGFVLVYGAPYLPTLSSAADTALDLLDLQAGQTLLELGCGDGRVARRAAARGLKVVGYELNPILVLMAKVINFRYRRQVTIKWANYWQAKWPPTDGIFVFLLDRFMQKLDNKITQEYHQHPVKLASYAFKIKGKKIAKTAKGIYLYQY